VAQRVLNPDLNMGERYAVTYQVNSWELSDPEPSFGADSS
jgi:hypothetical protein